jgi:hypothetical protein
LLDYPAIWYAPLSPEITNDLSKFKAAFFKRFTEDDHIIDLAILQTAQGPNESVRDYLNRLFDIPDQVVLAVGINRLRSEIKAIVMNREPTNIEELWHSMTLAEKTISSTVSSINHKLSQILALHQHIAQASRLPPHETDSYQNRPFVEEYQTYKQPQYLQFNSRKNYQAESRNTYLPPLQIITDKIATDLRKGHVSSHQLHVL